MKVFDYGTAINQLGLSRAMPLSAINENLIPKWVRGKDFITLFLPFVKIIGDSREQDHWIETACKYYGIAFDWARKDAKTGTENLKEGDYTFKVIFANKTYDYTGKVAYERKGSISEFYGNCVSNKNPTKNARNRVKKEFARFSIKEYDKVVLMLEFGEKMTDLIDMEFSYRSSGGKIEQKNTNYILYSTVMSWKQPNNKSFEILQSPSHEKLFWLFLQDCFYYFRNELRNECAIKGILEQKE